MNPFVSVFRVLASSLILLEALGLIIVIHAGSAARGGHWHFSNPVANQAVPASRREYHVSPFGRAANEGTMERPLDLATALSKKSPARPGDTIWLHGGKYRGVFVSQVNGAPGAPIIVRQYPNERATIDSSPSPKDALLVVGNWTWFWGFEIMNSNPIRYSRKSGSWPDDLHRGGGVTARGAHLKFINMVVHDMSGAFGIWDESVETELSGNLIYYNGWQAPDRGHGHGIYTQNRADRPRMIRDNIIFDQFSHGIHAFGSDRAYLDNIVLEGNVSFNNGSVAGDFARDILVGGGRIARNPVVRDNLTYGGAETNIGYSAGCTNGTVTDNYFAGASLMLVRCSANMERNTIYSKNPAEQLLRDHFPHNDYHDEKPSGVVVRVRADTYEAGRAHITVYNWDHRSRIRANVSAACGARDDLYEIRDAQDFFSAPVASGRCGDGLVDIEMQGRTIAAPVGDVPVSPQTTAPEFGVFVLMKASPQQLIPSTSAPTRERHTAPR